jgi:hypothetical protein
MSNSGCGTVSSDPAQAPSDQRMMSRSSTQPDPSRRARRRSEIPLERFEIGEKSGGSVAVSRRRAALAKPRPQGPLRSVRRTREHGNRLELVSRSFDCLGRRAMSALRLEPSAIAKLVLPMSGVLDEVMIPAISPVPQSSRRATAHSVPGLSHSAKSCAPSIRTGGTPRSRTSEIPTRGWRLPALLRASMAPIARAARSPATMPACCSTRRC